MLHGQNIPVRILLDELAVLSEEGSFAELAGESLFSLVCGGLLCILHSRAHW